MGEQQLDEFMGDGWVHGWENREMGGPGHEQMPAASEGCAEVSVTRRAPSSSLTRQYVDIWCFEVRKS